MIDFLKRLLEYFDINQIPYMLSGSVAMSLYIVPRFTRDIDIVVNLKPQDIKGLAEYFREGYYLNEESVRGAIQIKSMFNIIDHQTGYKVDFVILKDDEFHKVEFSRRRKIEFLGMDVFVVSPEDLLISKLVWIQALQSAIQMEDIKALWQSEGLDRPYVSNWVSRLKLNTFDLLQE